jgi:hypothetical protein
VEAFDPDTFWDNVQASGDCWVWTGDHNPAGYGRTKGFTFTERLAHRLSWTMANGPIPAGMWVLHHCDNPPCVNPDHLYVGTPSDNAQDRERRGRGHHPTGPQRTHCAHGHAFTPENTIRFSDGGQRCRICARARNSAYKKRRRALAKAAA